MGMVKNIVQVEEWYAHINPMDTGACCLLMHIKCSKTSLITAVGTSFSELEFQ